MSTKNKRASIYSLPKIQAKNRKEKTRKSIRGWRRPIGRLFARSGESLDSRPDRAKIRPIGRIAKSPQSLQIDRPIRIGRAAPDRARVDELGLLIIPPDGCISPSASRAICNLQCSSPISLSLTPGAQP